MYKNKLISFLLCVLCQWTVAQDRIVEADINSIREETNRFYEVCIGAGRAKEGLRADWQQQLRQLKTECGFQYIRFHGVLHDDMGVYTEDIDGNPIYNWHYVDQLYDFILSIGMKPFVELSFMPAALAQGDKTVFWWKANITPPKSYKKYSDLILAFTKHLTERYGKDEVKTWRFEVWNNPNHRFFFSGSQLEFFKIYATITRAIKMVSEDYLVGGPATAAAGWVEEFLDYCNVSHVPIDFVSTHISGVNGFVDQFGTTRLILNPDSSVIMDNVSRVKRQMTLSATKPLELHFTKWTSSHSPRDPVHDVYQNATYVANVLRHSGSEVTSMSYWSFTDIFEEEAPPVTPFHGGFGLLTREGLKKPTYYVYEFLHQLGKYELNTRDQKSWVCKDENDNVQALIYDFDLPDQGKESNDAYFKRVLPPGTEKDMLLILSNAKGKYKLTVTRVGFKANDVYTAYVEAGAPHHINRELLKKLKEAENSVDEEVVVTAKKGIIEKRLTLRENDILFLSFTKI